MNAEILRRIESLLKIGVIHSVDHANALVRVKTGEIITHWIGFFSVRAGTTTTWSPPTVGEQVMILSPSGDLNTGIALIGIYTKGIAPSQSPDEHVIQFADNAKIVYNQKNGHLEVSGIKTAKIQAGVSVTLATPTVNCTGNLNVADTITAGTDCVANGISLVNHVHGGVASGPSTTGQPQ